MNRGMTWGWRWLLRECGDDYARQMFALRTFHQLIQQHPPKKANAMLIEKHGVGLSDWMIRELQQQHEAGTGPQIDWTNFPEEPSSIDDSVFDLLQIVSRITEGGSNSLEGDRAIRALATSVADVVLDIRTQVAKLRRE